MAIIGLKYPIYSVYTETDNTASYGTGKVMAKAIKADISIDIAEAEVYADNAVAESVKIFNKGTISLQVSDLSDAIKTDLYGHTLVDAGISGDTETKMLVSNGEDMSKYVGVGFYTTRIVNNVSKYRAIWLTKNQFGVPKESFETKGKSTAFQTQTTDATIMVDVDGNWKKEVTVDTEAKAKAWLNLMANIVD